MGKNHLQWGEDAKPSEDSHVYDPHPERLRQKRAIHAEKETAAADQYDARRRSRVQHHAFVDQHRELVLIGKRPEIEDTETPEHECGE